MNWIKQKVRKYLLNRDIKEVGQKRVKKILDNQLPEHKILFLDGKYRIPDHKKLRRAIQGTTVEELGYQKDLWDCENFSLHFLSKIALEYNINACGMVLAYSVKHAFNIVLTHRNNKIKVSFFEPQEDVLLSPSQVEQKDHYQVEDQIILI